MKNRLFIGLVVMLFLVAVGAAAWFFITQYGVVEPKAKEPFVQLSDAAGKGTEGFIGVKGDNDLIAVKLFYPASMRKGAGGGKAAQDEAQEDMVIEERSIQNNPLTVQMSEAIVEEFLKGLNPPMQEAKLLGVYKDREGVLYVELSSEFSRNFSGTARDEFLLLKALYKSIVSNIVVIEDIKLLIDGKEIESIGGHFSSLYPLKETFGDN